MEEKMIWFGRYLGRRVKVMDCRGKEFMLDLTPCILLNILSGAYQSVKLVLKELKDILDEDLKELNEKFNRVWNRELLASNNVGQAKTA